MTATFLIWVAIAFAEAALWGAVVVIDKRILRVVSPLPVNFTVRLVCVTTLIVVMLPLAFLHLWTLGFGMTWAAAGYIAVYSLLTWLLAFNFYYVVLRSGKVGLVIPLTSIDPLFTALFAVVILGAVLQGLTVAGVVVTIAGILLITRWIDRDLDQHAEVLSGEVPVTARPAPAVVTLALATAACWGLGPVLIELAQRSVGGASVTMILESQLLAVPLLGGLLRWRRPPRFTRPLTADERRRAVLLMIVVGVLESLFSVTYYLLIQEIGAVYTTLIVATSPLFAIAGGVVFLKERIGPKLALGAAVTLSGVFLATLQKVL